MVEQRKERQLTELMAEAARLRDRGHGRLISYSRKVFIPLTHLCRDVCHYCTFAERPKAGQPAFLSPDQVLAIARAGAAAGCTEALFTLGDKPELRYRAAREALAASGHASTIEYLRDMCALVLKETGLLPHANPGVMTREEIAALRCVSASQGVMLESTSRRLCEPGGVHFGSPDKLPERRLETIRLALTAAETGHLVFATVHTSSAAKTIDRIIDVFPAGEKPMVRSMLSESLRAVISQSLLKKVGGGRVAAHEIMVGIPAIRNLIREDKVAQMYSSIQTGSQYGMQTLDQCLQDMVKRGLVTRQQAIGYAKNKEIFK